MQFLLKSLQLANFHPHITAKAEAEKLLHGLTITNYKKI